MNNNEVNIRIAYIYGLLEANGLLINTKDLDQVTEIVEEITKNWINKVGIKSENEEGYPTEYAERVLLEKYRK